MIGDGNFISQVPLFGGLDDAQQVSLQQKSVSPRRRVV